MKWIRSLYDWVLRFSATPHAMAALFLIALTESIFFPIPPDVLLIAMAVALPKRSFTYALVCLVGSITGGFIGYFIGAGLMDTVGQFIVSLYGAEEMFANMQSLYNEKAVWLIALSGFTPIPYKIFALSSGAFDVSLPLFIGVSSISRAARFFLVAGLIRLFGPTIRGWIDRYFNLLTIIFSIALILGFILVKYLL